MKVENKASMKHIVDVMDRHPGTVDPDADLSVALDLFEHKCIETVPVVDADKKLLGVVSTQDCLHSLLQSSFYCGETPRVKEVMSTSYQTIAPEESLLSLAQAMEQSSASAYMVVKGGRLVGTILRKDVVQLLRSELHHCSRSAHA